MGAPSVNRKKTVFKELPVFTARLEKSSTFARLDNFLPTLHMPPWSLFGGDFHSVNSTALRETSLSFILIEVTYPVERADSAVFNLARWFLSTLSSQYKRTKVISRRFDGERKSDREEEILEERENRKRKQDEKKDS